MKWLKKCIIPLIVTLLFYLPYHSKAEGKIYNHILAIINEEIVTQTEFHRVLESLLLETAHSSIPENNIPPQLGGEALQSLIDERLQLQEAQKIGISVFPEEIDRSIREIKTKNGLTSDWELEKALLSQNMTMETLQANIKKSILLLKLRERAVRSKINLNDTEITDYFTRYKEKKAGSIHLSHILFSIPQETQEVDETTITQIHDKALKVWEELHEGIDFAEAAEKYSQDLETCQQGGDLGYLELDQICLPFKKEIANLKVGQFSRPIRTPFGFHLIKLNAQQPLTLIKDSSQWNKIKETLINQKVEQYYQQWLKKLREQAYIDIKTTDKHE